MNVLMLCTLIRFSSVLISRRRSFNTIVTMITKNETTEFRH
jgi:hypothetical protein